MKPAFRVEELERALVGAEVGVWSWDAVSNHVRWSEQTERIFGLPPDSFTGTFDEYLTYIHADDVDGLRKSIDRAVTLADRAYRHSHRVVRPDRSIVWVD